ncbi:MAG: dihydrofolate reductase [Venatoribacter sp.]
MLSIIIAFAQNRVMGRDNQMPWHLPNDLQYFKKTTMGKPMIMGRKTYESIGKPLPGRPHIIITRDANYQPPNANDKVQVVTSFDAALVAAKQLLPSLGSEEIMVIGGAEICKLALPSANRLYLTEVHAEVEGDIYFPEFDQSLWQETSRESYAACEKNPYDYSFVVLERI